MEATPTPPAEAPQPAAAAPAPAAPAAAPVAPPAPTFKPAPDNLTCKVCNAPLRYGQEGKTSQEFVCSTLKDDSPILTDKYEEWRNHWVASRVVRSK
ncbi:MAG: hypothetical protein V4498_02290 [candidate division FCPU426 bacterium]